MIRVLVADDQATVRGGFAAMIDAQDEMQVVGEAVNGREAVDLARRTFPHVVLMDIRMPVLDGLKATRLICSDPNLARTRVLVLTTFDLDDYVYNALRLGASGFLLKDIPPRELLRAIEIIAAGAPVQIRLEYGADRITLEVENGPGASSNTNGSTPGVGITGMSERAAALGGTLRAAPTAAGFRVDAELPYTPA